MGKEKGRLKILSSALGRVEPEWGSGFVPETCHSQVLRDKILKRAVKDG
jgi:hypothetical protein